MVAMAESTAAPRLKLVIRRLPPTLPEEIFWSSVQPWVNDETCHWRRFVKGRASDGPNGSSVFSRAYCLMANLEHLIEFHRGYDGHLFRSKTGAEYQAVVEFAPVQKTPYRAKTKTDARQATIDDDPDYLSFLESLNNPTPKPTLEPTVPAPPPTSTPLLDHLRNRGTKSTKSAKSAESSKSATDARREAALASVSKAAAKRTPQNVGVSLVAGKGRQVKITPASSIEVETESAAPEKKSRNRKKGANASSGPHGSSGLIQDSSTALPTSDTGGGRGRGRGARGREGRGGESARPTTVNRENRDSEGDQQRATGIGSEGRDGGEGRATGEGRGRGRSGDGRVRSEGRGGRGRGGNRTARGAVVQILTNNATRPDPANARIDM
ncbi:Smg-4/UPF3 family-domain-containing protein [Naematelia encephala]|uniref:Smg-4/UPF3 family-domain-containing protein n=1 Tax=Naematelia encephala TaxID=71784 RepID=A0A1Y2BJ11_9TREE|nr:Smg-4/UPF3 family-domain-containing protein [Naematelia encephala]